MATTTRRRPSRLAEEGSGLRMTTIEQMAKMAKQINAAIAADKAAALALTPVSRETEARLDRYVGLLLEWQAKTNLLAAATLPNLWTPHIADSLQLFAPAPPAKNWIDLGRGGGLSRGGGAPAPAGKTEPR